MEAPRHWRTRKQRYMLMGEICPHCDEKIFPPRDICPNLSCGKNTFTQPVSTRRERDYYAQKGIIFEEKVRNTRLNVNELVGN